MVGVYFKKNLFYISRVLDFHINFSICFSKLNAMFFIVIFYYLEKGWK